MYKRSQAIRENALGPDHPDVASSLDGLAGLFSDQVKAIEYILWSSLMPTISDDITGHPHARSCSREPVTRQACGVVGKVSSEAYVPSFRILTVVCCRSNPTEE